MAMWNKMEQHGEINILDLLIDANSFLTALLTELKCCRFLEVNDVGIVKT